MGPDLHLAEANDRRKRIFTTVDPRFSPFYGEMGTCSSLPPSFVVEMIYTAPLEKNRRATSVWPRDPLFEMEKER